MRIAGRRYRGLIRPGTRWRWVVVLLLALTVSGLEALGAVLVYTLVELSTASVDSVDLPLLGDISSVAPGLDADRLVIVIACAVGLFFVVRGVVVLGQTYVQTRVANAASVDLSSRLLDQYLRLPYAFHLQRNSSDLIRNANEAVNEILNNILVPAIRLFADLVLILGLTLVLLVTAPLETAIAALLLGPLVALTLRSIQPRVGDLGATNQRESGRSIQLLQHSLHGFRDITLLGRQRHFVAEYGRSRRTIARTYYLRDTLSSIPRVVIETTVVTLIGAFLALSVRRGNAAESLAIVGLFGYASLRIMPALEKVAKNLNDLRFGRAALDDVQRDLELSHPANDGGVHPLPFHDRIRLEAVSFTHPGNSRPTLYGMDLTIPRGSSLGIVGVTGSGKSTLIDLLIGLSAPTTGRITIDGVDLAGNERAWHRNLGMVSQDAMLLDDSLRRNIALGLPDREISDEQVRHAAHLAQLDDFIASLPEGLDTSVGERGTRVSGGQRQRIAIARALYPHPSVLFFDEGTAALDNTTEAALIEALAALQHAHTVVTVAHRLSTVRDHDQILFLREGQVEGLGTFDDLLERNAAFRDLARANPPAAT